MTNSGQRVWLNSKFRLSRVAFEFEEVTGTSADDYRRAVNRVLERLPAPPHLALVQTRQSFSSLAGRVNPYFVAKAAFMSGGVPVQSTVEEIAGDLGIYFADPRIFTRMVVYVYDDSDEAAPERYAVLRNALRAHDSLVIDVVVVRRPMIPGRKERGQKQRPP